MLKLQKKKLESTTTEEPEEETYLTYTINVTGDFIINIGENCDVKIMSGQPTNPNPKPPGGGQ
jgi:hypothetical protein